MIAFCEGNGAQKIGVLMIRGLDSLNALINDEQKLNVWFGETSSEMYQLLAIRIQKFQQNWKQLNSRLQSGDHIV